MSHGDANEKAEISFKLMDRKSRNFIDDKDLEYAFLQMIN